MFPKKYGLLINLVILATTLPFLLLLTQVNWSLYPTNQAALGNQLIASIANITGLIGGSLLVWQFLVGTRYLVQLITPDIIGVNRIHRRLGIYGSIFVLTHPFLEMVVYMKSLSWVFIPEYSSEFDMHINQGRIAFLLFLIVYISSAILRGSMKYRPWLYIHYLSYPLTIFVFLHSLEIGTYLNQFVALKALWLTVMAMYLALVIFRIGKGTGLLKNRYRLTSHTVQGQEIQLLTLTPTGRSRAIKPGQYFYLQLRLLGESHPFTVMEYEDNGKLIFAIKALGSFTRRLAKLPLGATVYVDGPYGVFTQEAQNDEPKVIIAGGVGVTPFVELVKQFSSPSTIFIHSNRRMGDVVAREKLQSFLGNRYFDFLSQDDRTGPNIVNSRLESKHLLHITGSRENLLRHKFLVCGSPIYVQGVKSMLHELQIPKSQVFVEEFSL